MPYRVPLFIIEVEGAKNIWGSGEQEHKALEEAAGSLAFVPDTYLLFIYHNRFKFWHAVHNPIDRAIDVKAYPVYVQQGSTIPFHSKMQKNSHKDRKDPCQAMYFGGPGPLSE